MYRFLIKVTVLADMVSMSAMARPPHPLQGADVISGWPLIFLDYEVHHAHEYSYFRVPPSLSSETIQKRMFFEESDQPVIQEVSHTSQFGSAKILDRLRTPLVIVSQREMFSQIIKMQEEHHLVI